MIPRKSHSMLFASGFELTNVTMYLDSEVLVYRALWVLGRLIWKRGR